MNQNLQLIIYATVDAVNKQYEIDMFDNEAVPVNKSITDVNNFAQRKSPFTKTFRLPGTANNNAIFGYIFDLASNVFGDDLNENFAPDFNPSLKANVILYKNTIMQIAGYMQLTNVYLDDEQRIEYEVDITGRTANLFQDIANLKLNQLDLSAYDHDYTAANIIASWDAPVGEGYVYPLIDYGLSSDEKEYFVEDMFPAVYVKTLVDKIFSQAGYRYESAFFESERFKRLIVPYSGKQNRLTQAQIDDRTFEARESASTGYTTLLNSIDGSTTNRVPFTTLIDDSFPAGYNTSNSSFTIPFGYSGRYTFVSGFEFSVKNMEAVDKTLRHVKFSMRCLRDGREIILTEQSISIRSTPFGLNAEYNTNVVLTTPEMYFAAGDIIYVTAYWPGNNPSGVEIRFIVNTIPMDFYCEAAAMITDGGFMELSSTLADDVNQSDFLVWLIQMFNIYIEVDSLDDRKLIMEPRDDFYTDDVIDLTASVDVSNTTRIEPLGALQYKTYNYSYTEDKDLANTQHQNKFKDTYGNRRFEIINDFVKEEFEMQVGFAPTPLRDARTKNNRIISKIWFLDAAGQRTDSVAKIRILYYAGMVDPPANLDQWHLTSRFTGVSRGSYNYPYAGHLNHTETPNFDLSFGVPLEVQYAAFRYTDANLFNLYHRKGILEISDRNSRIVEYSLKLNEVQLRNMSFRPFYLIDQHYYRLYEINYDANSDVPAVVRFLKLNAGPQQDLHFGVSINGGTGEFGSAYELFPTWHKLSDRNATIFEKGGDTMIQGSGNTASRADDIVITGRENAGMADGIVILGGALNIASMPGAKLLNCTGYIQQYEDEVAINNIQQPLYGRLSIPASSIITSAGTPIQILPRFYGFITEVVRSYCTIYNVFLPYDNADIFLAYGSAPSTPILSWSPTLISALTKTRQKGALVEPATQSEDTVVFSSNINPVGPGDSYAVIEVEYKLIPIP